MTMILYNVPDGCVHPTTIPDAYSVTVPVPPFTAKKKNEKTTPVRPYFNVPTEHYSAQAIIPYENIKYKTSRSFDITLTNTIYTVIIDIDDNTHHHQIARSELVEAYTNQQAIRAELMIDRVKDTMSVDDTMGQTFVLRHIFNKTLLGFSHFYKW